jgi:hypothetical protein
MLRSALAPDFVTEKRYSILTGKPGRGNERHRRRRSMIFTTTKSLSVWGRVLHDEDLPQAIVDRVLERGRLLMLDGPSMRTKQLAPDLASIEGSHPPGTLARISGNPRPDFRSPQVGLVRQCNGLQGVVAALATAMAGRDPPKAFINEEDQILPRHLVCPRHPWRPRS